MLGHNVLCPRVSFTGSWPSKQPGELEVSSWSGDQGGCRFPNQHSKDRGLIYPGMFLHSRAIKLMEARLCRSQPLEDWGFPALPWAAVNQSPGCTELTRPASVPWNICGVRVAPWKHGGMLSAGLESQPEYMWPAFRWLPTESCLVRAVRQLTPRRQSVCNLSFVSAFKGPHTVINALYTFSPRGCLTLLCPWSLLKRSGLLPSHLSGLSRLLRRTCSTSTADHFYI